MSNLHNELKGASAHSLAIRRMFGGRDELAVERLSETLQPIVNPYDHPYCAYLRGERLCWGSGSMAAAIGFRSKIQLYNPAGSQLLVIVEEIRVDAPAAGVYQLQMGTTEFTGTPLAAGPRDGRWVPFTTSATRAHLNGENATASPGQVFYNLRTAATEDAVYNRPIILPPGFGVMVTPDADNLALRASLSWTEKPVLEGELVT